MLEAPIYKAVPAPMTLAGQTERQQYLAQLRVKLHQKLVEKLNVQNLRSMPSTLVRQECRNLIRDLYQNEKALLTSAEQEKLMDDVMDETFGDAVRDIHRDEARLMAEDASSATRIELAKAYLDIGDLEGARSMLEEVFADGGPAAKAEAERILKEIG